MDYRKEFVVKPGDKVRLDKIDPGYKGKHEIHEHATAEIASHVARMDQLQNLLYADGSQSLLIVLQALDAGGKDGVVRHLFSGMNPRERRQSVSSSRAVSMPLTTFYGVCICEYPPRVNC